MVLNVTGWNELINGSIFLATTVMYQSYYGDWYITILFLMFKIMLYLSTRSAALGFFVSMVFLGVSLNLLTQEVQAIVITIAVIEMSMVIYSAIFKK